MAGRIYVTGDCHGEFQKLSNNSFPINKKMDKDDYVIICGDFGGVWSQEGESVEETNKLDWLEERNFTTLFVDGNHENFARLNAYTIEQWNGGKVHKIRPSVIHLMRGQVYEIAGNKIFTFGGAKSHDISGGILDPTDEKFHVKRKEYERDWVPYRIKGISWWEEELPNQEELEEALRNLARYNNKVDYIITHCCSNSMQDEIKPDGSFLEDIETNFFEKLYEMCTYNKWYFGHYHEDMKLSNRDSVLYHQIVELGKNAMSAVPGYPTHQDGDFVSFSIISEDRKLVTYEGVIVDVRPYGSDEQDEEPEYTIALEDGNCVFQNVRESDLDE